MTFLKYLMSLTLSVIFLSSVAVSENTTTTNIGSKLPPRVKGLLIQEMNALSGATSKILDALVRGQHDIVEQNAQAIHDSFILKKEMTPEDKKELLSAVPTAFVKQDRAFHALGAKLAEAARQKDTVRQQKLVSSLIDACVTCHTQYAANSFPGLNKNNPQIKTVPIGAT